MPRMTIISEEVPIAYTGRIWVRPSVGASLKRFGNSWIPNASFDVPFTYKYRTILINDTDVTSYVSKNSIGYEDNLTSQVDTFEFTIFDKTNNYKPLTGQEVVLFVKNDADDTPYRKFGGFICQVEQIRVGIDTYRYVVSCVDYGSILNNRLVIKTYTNELLGDIVKNIIATYAPEIGTYYIEDGKTISYIEFNYETAESAIKRLVRLIGYDYYVDADGELHLFYKTTNTAPFDITEDSSSGNYDNLQITFDRTSLINRVYVNGGYQYSTSVHTTTRKVYEANQSSFLLDYEPTDNVSIVIKINAGAAETYQFDGVATTGYDFSVISKEKLCVCLDQTALSTDDILTVEYYFREPIRVQRDNSSSIVNARAKELGLGIRAKYINDPTIVSFTAARERADAELRDNNDAMLEGSFNTLDNGYRSGQLLTINLPNRSESGVYLITRVSAKPAGIKNFKYTIQFGTMLKGLDEFLFKMYDSTQKITERTDNRLDLIKSITSDGFEFTNATLSHSLYLLYVWNNDAGNYSGNTAIWNNDTEDYPGAVGKWRYP